MNISDLLNSDLGKQIISGIGGQTGTSASQTSSVLSAALPAILGGLQKNATEGDGDGILSALQSHDGNMLDNLTDFLGNKNAVAADGNGILGHVFGSQLGAVQNGISKKSGVDAGKVSNIIAMAAPVVMGILGKQQRSVGVKDTNGLTDMLGSLLGGNGNNNIGSNILSSLLDRDGDGKVEIDDVADILGGLFGKK
ncbi:MAG: DUF937 domain-containing protein [Tannerella sp.]|jgi:hypothetical protein|nr:DUF937 domain-containing protein [Tannerella sp.]